jgi:hypothetical protein
VNEYTGSAPQSDGSPPQSDTAAMAREQAASVGQSAAEAGSHVAQTATQAGSHVAQTAAEAGSHVAQTAADQAREVASQTARQARDLLGEAGAQTRDQASLQQQKAAGKLRSVAEELEEMAANGGQSGLATEVAHQAAARIHTAASWLEQREPVDVLAEVKDFARRRPGMFLAAAAVAGLAAGRLTRGMTAATAESRGDTGAGLGQRS